MTALLILIIYALLVRKQPLLESYAKIFAVEWIFLLSIYLMYQKEFVPLSNHFSFVFLMFFVPFVLADYYWSKTIHYIPEIRFPAVISANLFFMLACAAAVLSVGLAVHAVRSIGVASFAGFRELFVGSDEIGPVSIGTGVSFPLVCGAWYLSRVMEKRYVSLLFGFLAIILAILTTSKVFLFIALIYAVPLASNGKPTMTAKTFINIAVAALVTFALLHLFLGKIAGIPGQQGILEGLMVTLRVYLLGAIAGLQHVLDGTFIYPHNQMWIFVANLFPDFVEAPKTIILPWSSIGIWETNVYSAFASWYEAVGVLGLAVIGFLLGSFYAWLFRSCSTLLFLRIFSLFPLLFMFHQDFFFESVRIWIGFSFVAVLIDMTYTYPSSSMEVIRTPGNSGAV